MKVALYRFRSPLAIIIACALVAACAAPEAPSPAPAPPPAAREPPTKPAIVPPPKPKPPAPPPEPVAEPPKEPPRSLGLDELAKGVRSYEDGDYPAATKQLQAALDLGLAAPSDRAAARKHLAFIACGAKRIALCRGEFRKAFADDPSFDLSRAESGHPVWGPVFRSVRAEVAGSKSKAARKPR
jgi:hypothetical protein